MPWSSHQWAGIKNQEKQHPVGGVPIGWNWENKPPQRRSRHRMLAKRTSVAFSLLRNHSHCYRHSRHSSRHNRRNHNRRNHNRRNHNRRNRRSRCNRSHSSRIRSCRNCRSHIRSRHSSRNHNRSCRSSPNRNRSYSTTSSRNPSSGNCNSRSSYSSYRNRSNCSIVPSRPEPECRRPERQSSLAERTVHVAQQISSSSPSWKGSPQGSAHRAHSAPR